MLPYQMILLVSKIIPKKYMQTVRICLKIATFFDKFFFSFFAFFLFFFFSFFLFSFFIYMCVYIDDAIKWLVEHEFYDIPFEDLKADFHVFWNYVKDNQDRRLIAIPLCIIKKQIRNIGPLFFVFLFFSNFFSIFFFFFSSFRVL